MATLSTGYTWQSGDLVTPALLNQTVNSANITNIANADVANNAAIALSKLATGALPTAITVASANIVDQTIVNDDINGSAAISHSKLASITAGQVLLGNANNVPTATALSGDVTINSLGVTAISSDAIVNADINGSAAISHSKLANMTAGQVLLGNANNVPTATALSGDVTVNSVGVTAIGTGVIVNDDINNLAGIAHAKLANMTAGQVLLGSASNVPTSTALSGDVTVNSSGVTAIGTGVIVNDDINDNAAIALSKLATGALPTAITVASANIVDGTIVAGDIASGAITAAKLDGAQTGSAPIYGCRAWVNFQGDAADNLAGTYTRTGTDVTVTASAHGLIVGNVVQLDFTGGSPTSAADATYTVTQVDDANNFHVTTSATGTSTGGTVALLRRRINAAGNVSSVTYLNAAGQYAVNFSISMQDANYAVSVGSRNMNTVLAETPAPTAQSFRISTFDSTPAAVNDGFTNCVVFR